MSPDSQHLATRHVADGTLATRDDGLHVLRFERHLAHPVDRVWLAISEPERMTSWFPANVEWDFKAGGAIHYHFPEMGPGGDGEITELDPPNLLEYTWSGQILRFELQPVGNGCLLTFIHTFDDGKGAAKFAAGWHGCLYQLESSLKGESRDSSLAQWDGIYEEYAEKFGQRAGVTPAPDPNGTIETVDGAYILRFERYFDRPAERVWAALTGPDELVTWLAEADVDLVEGGRFNLRWLNTDDEGNTAEMTGTITSLNWPYTSGSWPYVLEVDSDIHGLLRWEIREDVSGCVLTFSVTLPAPNDYRSELLAGWHIHLDHLAGSLHGSPVDWSRWTQDYRDQWSEYRDRYAATLA